METGFSESPHFYLVTISWFLLCVIVFTKEFFSIPLLNHGTLFLQFDGPNFICMGVTMSKGITDLQKQLYPICDVLSCPESIGC